MSCRGFDACLLNLKSTGVWFFNNKQGSSMCELEKEISVTYSKNHGRDITWRGGCPTCVVALVLYCGRIQMRKSIEVCIHKPVYVLKCVVAELRIPSGLWIHPWDCLLWVAKSLLGCPPESSPRQVLGDPGIEVLVVDTCKCRNKWSFRMFQHWCGRLLFSIFC